MRNKVSSFLIVDDNELDVEKIARGVRPLGFGNDIVHAEDGYEALDILRGECEQKLQTPFVIFLDLNMPRMNGLEFLETLRADPALSYLPVFVLTTSDRPSDIEEAYKWNVSGYIVKPIKIDDVMQTLNILSDYLSIVELPSGVHIGG